MAEVCFSMNVLDIGMKVNEGHIKRGSSEPKGLSLGFIEEAHLGLN
jgi:hypothetical protein